MKLTVKQHKIAALNHARSKVASGEIEYICWALSDYCDEQESTTAYKAARYLKQYIARNLGADYNEFYKVYSHGRGLEDWLIEQGYVNNFHECWQVNPEKMIQTRLNWIDWMLECYGEKV